MDLNPKKFYPVKITHLLLLFNNQVISYQKAIKISTLRTEGFDIHST